MPVFGQNFFAGSTDARPQPQGKLSPLTASLSGIVLRPESGLGSIALWILAQGVKIAV